MKKGHILLGGALISIAFWTLILPPLL